MITKLILRYLLRKAIGYVATRSGLSAGAQERLLPHVESTIGSVLATARRIRDEYKVTDEQAVVMAVEFHNHALTTPSATVDQGLEQWMQNRTPELNS